MRTPSLALLSAALLSPGLAAQQLERARVSDVAAPVPGAQSVERALGSPGAPAFGPTFPQMPGWPRAIGGDPTFAPTRGLAFADLDGDGPKEVIVSSTDRRLYAFRADGSAMPGFPLLLNERAQTAPSVADLDADGDLEIVQNTRGLTSGGRLYVVDHTGVVLPGFPKSFNNGNVEATPTLADLDDDGELEIVACERAYPIGRIHVVERDGSTWGGNWPVAMDHVPTCSVAVGDVDADGELELCTMSYTSIYLLELDGTSLPGWPKQIANANFSYQSPALADLDGDGDLEIVVGAHQTAAGVYVYEHTGALVPGWPKLVGTWTYCAPTVVDLEGDGELDVVSGREGFGPGNPSACFWAWDRSGNVKPGFPFVSATGGGSAGPITAADLDGDGRMELFADHNIQDAGGGYLFGVDADGNPLPNFPLRTNGFTYLNGAQIDDVDGDGDLEMGVIATVSGTVQVNLFDLPDAFAPARAPWPTYHQTARRGGLEGGGDKLWLSGDVAPGGQMSYTIVGQPGHMAFVWLSTSIDSSSTPFGWLHLAQPFRRTLINGAPLPASGQRTTTLNVPSNPNLLGLRFYTQGLVVSGGVGAYTNLIGQTIQ